MASKEKEMPEAARYQIDVGWYQRNGKDLGEKLTNRRCSPCKKEINENFATPPTIKEHFAQFSKCCGTKDEYLGEYMGIKEIVFRILARDRNQAKTIEGIYKALSAHLQSRSYSRVIPASWLAKMLEADEIYGIHRV
jgi:hypothetical protein